MPVLPGFQLIPAGDDRQALRIRRYLMATGTSVMVVALLYVAYLLGGLEWEGSFAVEPALPRPQP